MLLMRWTLSFTMALAMILALILLAASFGPAAAAVTPLAANVSDSFAITGVRVFDGSEVIPSATVVVLHGRIDAVGPNVILSSGIPVIDGTGSTLLPGIIDAHSHARSRQELERAIQFGVTTELDMWTLRQFAASMRREQERTGAPYRADFFSAISPATLPEGYPYNFSPRPEAPTLSGPQEAEQFVADRFAEGSDYLKIMLEDGTLAGLNLPVLSRETVRALTQAVHSRGKLAVAHVTEQAYALELVEDGVDGLAHIFPDTPVAPGFVELAAAKGTFVVATLTAEESFVTTDGGASLIADPDLGPYLTREEKQFLLTPAPPNTMTPQNLQFAKDNVRLLRAAGVPILTGTDVPAHGVAIHRELELLVQAGLDPVDVLAGATAEAAAAFGLADRGRIAPGLRADLLLVKGDPTANIKATRRIQRIWKAGIEVDRALPAGPVQH
jgi:imidazolonepropionase-like amidohydrolase